MADVTNEAAVTIAYPATHARVLFVILCIGDTVYWYVADVNGSLIINIVAKGEIAQYEQFLLLPQYFSKSTVKDALECVCKCDRVIHARVLETDLKYFVIQ